MKWISQRFTFVLIPNANQTVKRYQIPKVFFVLIPAILLLLTASTTFLLYMFTFHTSKMQDLHMQLTASESSYEQLLHDKENQIVNLENSVSALSDQATLMENKMSEIAELELQLKEIAGIKEPAVQISSILELEVEGRGGEEIPILSSSAVPHDSYLWDPTSSPVAKEQLVNETFQSYSNLSSAMEELKPNLEATKEAIEQYLHILHITPTIWPSSSHQITSKFGVRRDPLTNRSAFHSGIDMGGARGEPIFATADGIVTKSERDYPHGNNIMIDHGRGIQTRYMHLNKLLVNAGDHVTKGQIIGELGNTGRSTGPHIHYEVIVNGSHVDPTKYLTEELKE